MSNVQLPPQKSPTDTSNWDDRAFSAPIATSVGKVKKSIERRQMIPNARKRQKRTALKELDIKKSR